MIYIYIFFFYICMIYIYIYIYVIRCIGKVSFVFSLHFDIKQPYFLAFENLFSFVKG